MSREIRITVDDDEVFERMRRRKRQLDLSWEDVLHRGLWGDSERRDVRDHGQQQPYGVAGDDIGDRLERRIRNRVEESLMTAFGAEEAPQQTAKGASQETHGFEEEMESLESAEDAVLVFPFLDDDAAYRVPLRISLEMQAGGVDIEVVTVRQGKSVDEMNSFDRAARKRIAEELATGASVALELEAGVEEYRVAPILGWSRNERGAPTVTDVEIDEVIFDTEQ